MIFHRTVYSGIVFNYWNNVFICNSLESNTTIMHVFVKLGKNVAAFKRSFSISSITVINYFYEKTAVSDPVLI